MRLSVMVGRTGRAPRPWRGARGWCTRRRQAPVAPGRPALADRFLRSPSWLLASAKDSIPPHPDPAATSSALLARAALGEDPVQSTPGLDQDPPRLADLRLVAGLRHLHVGHEELHPQVAKLEDLVGHGAGHRLPRRGELLTVRLDVGAARIGELERAPAVPLDGVDEAFVLELLQRRVHRPWAGPPHSPAALGDVLDDLVPVERLLGQQSQGGGADVTAPDLGTAPERPARAWPAEPGWAEC